MVSLIVADMAPQARDVAGKAVEQQAGIRAVAVRSRHARLELFCRQREVLGRQSEEAGDARDIVR
ncbi:hypothetical protein D9M70_466830 [compost metagenome]